MSGLCSVLSPGHSTIRGYFPFPSSPASLLCVWKKKQAKNWTPLHLTAAQQEQEHNLCCDSFLLSLGFIIFIFLLLFSFFFWLLFQKTYFAELFGPAGLRLPSMATRSTQSRLQKSHSLGMVCEGKQEEGKEALSLSKPCAAIHQIF